MPDEKSTKNEPLITASEIENIIKELEKKEKIKKQMELMKGREIPPEKAQESFLTQLERVSTQDITPSAPSPPPQPTTTQPSIRPAPPTTPSTPPVPPSNIPPAPSRGPITPENVSPFATPTPSTISPSPKTATPQTRKTTSSPILSFIKYLFLFIFLFVLIYAGLNFSAYKDLGSYLYSTKIKKETPKNLSSVTLPVVPETSEINLPDSLIIPKINIQAPITWEVEPEKEIEALKNGIVHFKGTALPNEQGTMVLTGHSSSYPWAKGKYDQVFTLIYQLNSQDEIAIIYHKKKYVYKVTNKKIISPQDFKILTTSEEDLNLVTCWPIGTSLKRMVVGAILSESSQEPGGNYLPTAQ